MAEASVAHVLLQAAQRDAAACMRLAEYSDIHDSIVGFHAQQAIEKSIKAVLSHRRIEFRRTHDLAELLDLMADNGISPPPHADSLDELNPFAVAARYSPFDPGSLDRDRALRRMADVITWAGAQLDLPAPGGTGAGS